MTPPIVPASQVHRTSSTDLPDILPGFEYQARYATWGTLRYSWVETYGSIVDVATGNKVTAAEVAAKVGKVVIETVLALSGEPSWSYLYRKMIPGLCEDISPRKGATGFVQRRVLAPDFIGFGRSDKPIDDAFYTFGMHRDFLVNFIRKHIEEHPDTLTGGRVSLIVQDWGGIEGLACLPLFPDLFSHLLVMNTALGLGVAPTKGWLAFRDFMASRRSVDIGAMMLRGTPLTKQEASYYDAPFAAGEIAKAGGRAFPPLVPVNPNMRGVAESKAALAYYRALPAVAYLNNTLTTPSAPQGQGGHTLPGKPLRVFVACGMKDPVLGEPVMRPLAELAWAGIGYHWHAVKEGGHFVQEWCDYLPAIVDKAWADEEASFTVGQHEVQWNAPRELEPLKSFAAGAPPPGRPKQKL